MEDLEIPYYPLLGNHDYQINYDVSKHEGVTANDLQIPEVEKVWKKVLDIDPYYSFAYEGINFIMLNSNKGSKRHVVCESETVESMCTGSFNSSQLTWFEDELSFGGKSFIFTHHPMYTEDTTPSEWAFAGESFMIWSGDGFYSVMDSNYKNILAGFVGHGHKNELGLYLDGTPPVYETGSIGDYASSDKNIRIVNVIPGSNQIEVLSYDDWLAID